MRHGRLIGPLVAGMALLTTALLAPFGAPLLAAAPGAATTATATMATATAALEGRNVNVRAMVLAETRIEAGAQQLLQVTLANTNKGGLNLGLRVELRDGRDRRVGSPMTRRVTLAGKDEERFLFKFRVPTEQGDYAARVEVMTADFQAPLIPGAPVYFSPFVVGEGPPRPRPVSVQPARMAAPSYLPPSGLAFERPDLLWESLTVSPKSLLLGEALRIRADLRNVGGDLARNVQVRVAYFNTRTPNRTESISETTLQALAPGEKVELEFETLLPDESLLGEYRVRLTVDASDSVDELNETNNEITTDAIRLTQIKLIFPEPNFVFEEQGLFLFRWDSLRYDEFKVQVGTDAAFADEGSFFDLPQGEKWNREKEIVPLEGELPAMAQGLLEKSGSKRLYWRVAARDSKKGRTVFSDIQAFSITPQPAPQETPPPAAPQVGPTAQPGGPSGGQ